jgi:hypothetical protein
MAVSKTDQITALALEVLEDAEMSRTSAEALVMKASRLARLVDDEEAMRWLGYERLGYQPTGETSVKYIYCRCRRKFRRSLDKRHHRSRHASPIAYGH